MPPKRKGKGRDKEPEEGVCTTKTEPTGAAQVDADIHQTTCEEAAVGCAVAIGNPDAVAIGNPDANTDEESEDDGACSRRKKVLDLEPDVEQALCDWFSENAIFYDKSHRHFKNKHKKEGMLAEKAKEYNLTGEQLSLWFKSQRTMFGRLNKTKSGQACSKMTQRQKWNMKNFSFLKTHISVRTERKQLGKIPSAKPESGDEAEEEDEIDQYESSRMPTPTFDSERPGSSSIGQSQPWHSSRQGSRKRQQGSSQVDEAILKLVDQASGTQKLCQQVEEAMIGNKNPRTTFTHWIGAEVVGLPEPLWNSFQRDAFNLVLRYREMAGMQTQQSQLQPQLVPMFRNTPTTFAPQLPAQPASRPTSAPPSWQVQTQDLTRPVTMQCPIMFQQQELHPGGPDLNLDQVAYTAQQSGSSTADTGTLVIRSAHILQEQDKTTHKE